MMNEYINMRVEYATKKESREWQVKEVQKWQFGV